MNLKKIYKPIKYNGKSFQFYVNHPALDLPQLRWYYITDQLSLIDNGNGTQEELKAMANHIRETNFTENPKRAQEECLKIAFMLEYLANVETRLEPYVNAICHILFLKGEKEAPENIELKKNILYSDHDALCFFLKTLMVHWLKLTDSEEAYSEILKSHQRRVLNPNWISLMRQIGVKLRLLPKGREEIDS